MFSREYCEMFKNTYFEEHLPTAAYIFLIAEHDRKFLLIQIFNNRNCFMDVAEIYLIMNFILKYIPLVYFMSLVYFCILMMNL